MVASALMKRLANADKTMWGTLTLQEAPQGVTRDSGVGLFNVQQADQV